MEDCYCNTNGSDRSTSSSCGGGGGFASGTRPGCYMNNGVENNNTMLVKLYNLEPRFECSICLTCLKDPLLTSCGHRFCQACIQSWFKSSGTKCPIDGKMLSPDQDLFPDNYTRREIAQQLIECPFAHVCSLKQIPLLDIEQHIVQAHENTGIGQAGDDDAKGDALTCPFKSFGCNHTFTSRAQLFTHAQFYIQHHLELLAKGHHHLMNRVGDGSGIVAGFSATSNSKRCTNGGGCGGGGGVHQDTKAEEAQMWTPPSKHSSPHATLVASDESQPSPPSHLFIKTMYERIVLLEQSNQEQEIKLNNLKLKLDSVIADNTRLRTELPSRVCQGVYLWRITDFSRKKSAMTKDPSVMYYSEGFYTSFTGYKFCARLNISPHDPKYISLLVHVMRGENDHALSWPFSGRIAMTLVHPHCPDKALREVMCSRPELEAFKRPVKNMGMRGFGYTEFVQVGELVAQGYVDRDDSILVKLEITCV